MNYPQPHYKSPAPLQNYYNNTSNDPKTAQIKKVKSSESIGILQPTNPRPQNVKPQPKTKKPFIEPGTPCDSFEEVISTTCVTENGINTYFIAKALRGPLLQFASQQCNKKQPAKKPAKPIPELPESISGNLHPHIQGYATVTHEGLYRQTNDDKITIYLEENSKWFSIYDGHGGSKCSQFLKDRLHQYFFKSDWRKDIPNALRRAFIEADKEWKKKGDNSGSCAIVIFIHNNICYSANLGDSRAVLLSQQCGKCYQISRDHKPSNPDEQKRIIEAGGKIYQTTAITQFQQGFCDMITGPLRVFPGRLATTRSFGDFQAKDANEKIIINEPEISSFQIDEHDLIVMGSDGLWDKFDNTQVAEVMRGCLEKEGHGQNWYPKGTEVLLRQAMERGSTDNISLITVSLNDPFGSKEPKKGNEHIKIFSSMSYGGKKRGTNVSNKENNYPDKMKELDSKIMEINRSASKLLQQAR